MIAEMVDGAVVMSPSPGFGHSDMVLALAGVLRAAAPPQLRVLAAPFPVRLGRGTELRPDLLVARYVDLRTDVLTEPPLLAVEVTTPGGELLDRTLKKVIYARHGIPAYWLLDPETPALTALELDDAGDYRTVAEVVGPEVFAAVAPFPVEISPLWLVAGLRPC
jgi:Uma2 family endonuclease